MQGKQIKQVTLSVTPLLGKFTWHLCPRKETIFVGKTSQMTQTLIVALL